MNKHANRKPAVKRVVLSHDEIPRGESCLPIDYCQFYCEENSWKLIQRDSFADASAMFITNPNRQVAIWQQRAANEAGFVIWDYHVFVVSFDRQLVWDLDSRLGAPVSLKDWTKGSFPTANINACIAGNLSPMFHVIEREHFINVFRSDRSHMLVEGQYTQTPPAWPKISEAESNLMEYLDQSLETKGKWYSLEKLMGCQN